uniref:Uncharacterized protein n=1 Tax=Tanacetum cinerariifolium TaxID=118510 RepID=A0A699JKR7_TANCI|nr:hypothetical protein [Tanacetum cinerariifolium]
MILSVFKQLSNQVTNCNKVNKDNLISNESLSVELEKYKEWVILLEERQNVDLSTREKLIMDDITWKKCTVYGFKKINYLKQTLSEQSNEKELLTKTFNVFKNESNEKEAKNIDKEITLEKKVKELDNIVCKIAQQIRLMLYDGSVITKETNAIIIADSKETLMLEKESRSKMLLKQSDQMVLEKKVNIKPINYVKLKRLSKDYGKPFSHNKNCLLNKLSDYKLHTLIPTNLLLRLSKLRLLENFLRGMKTNSAMKFKRNNFLIENDRLLDQIISQDIMNIVVNSSMDINTSVNVISSAAMNNFVNYVEMCNKCLELEAELIKQHNMVEKDEYNKLSKRYSELEKHCSSFELAM